MGIDDERRQSPTHEYQTTSTTRGGILGRPRLRPLDASRLRLDSSGTLPTTSKSQGGTCPKLNSRVRDKMIPC